MPPSSVRSSLAPDQLQRRKDGPIIIIHQVNVVLMSINHGPDNDGHRSGPGRDLAVREGEQAAGLRLAQPHFGVLADQRSHYGRQAVRDREAALAPGVRVAVHDARQNDRNPVIWQAGQDYRAADAIQAARGQPIRARHGPERVGPER
jgi:hypothetical protein